jgi:hypothetical protein
MIERMMWMMGALREPVTVVGYHDFEPAVLYARFERYRTVRAVPVFGSVR